MYIYGVFVVHNQYFSQILLLKANQFGSRVMIVQTQCFAFCWLCWKVTNSELDAWLSTIQSEFRSSAHPTGPNELSSWALCILLSMCSLRVSCAALDSATCLILILIHILIFIHVLILIIILILMLVLILIRIDISILIFMVMRVPDCVRIEFFDIRIQLRPDVWSQKWTQKWIQKWTQKWTIQKFSFKSTSQYTDLYV